MCDVCTKPFDQLSTDQLDDQVQKLSATFVALPMVVGAPLLMEPEYYLEVARHQIECGVRICPDAAIKQFRVADGAEHPSWVYDETHADTETPAERVARAVREQREAYQAKVDRYRKEGKLPPLPGQQQPPVKKTTNRRKPKGKK